MNCIEPAFKLGRSASVKKKRDAVGHKDAVLALGKGFLHDSYFTYAYITVL